jgi:hypothetical protein
MSSSPAGAVLERMEQYETTRRKRMTEEANQVEKEGHYED